MYIKLHKVINFSTINFQSKRSIFNSPRIFSTLKTSTSIGEDIVIGNISYKKDNWTNVSAHLLSFVGKNIFLQKHHPLSLLRQRIVNFMYKRYVNRSRNPLFSVYDHLSPVVTLEQNFDSLLVPKDHVSRKISDSYYINSKYMLRAHTSAHQRDLILSGLDNFLVIGDVYRRDEIDSSHYPVFHQIEGVRLLLPQDLFKNQENPDNLSLFENGKRCSRKQECHTLEATLLMEQELKNCLTISGASEKIGWAFGLGLERLAMKLYSIPDIRLFWSTDSGFLSQFQVSFDTSVTYKPVSIFPQCTNDISFWIPNEFEPNDFFELVRSIGGDLIEQVYLIDEFFHKKKQQTSHCYRIVYRHMERTLRQDEVNAVHQEIENQAEKLLNVVVR
ncbi:probable phenylalanine--tRNA ligase, mitochondrial [Centruroides sculpturatus]|uniref:probable phenylalanine--tRNA ligase, mitochondrial n=1 Tax=Centruroides sculpturatus TaxID=218467 RepID=UPI000C6DA535|nr:probable phenylalanine--tRNA ligase, mitochondrial [Centruroides sculpturatus]